MFYDFYGYEMLWFKSIKSFVVYPTRVFKKLRTIIHLNSRVVSDCMKLTSLSRHLFHFMIDSDLILSFVYVTNFMKKYYLAALSMSFGRNV